MSGDGGVVFGLARIWEGQDEATVRAELRKGGARKIKSVNGDDDGGLTEMMEPGDTLMVLSIRDLGRTPKSIADCLAELKEKNADFVAINDGIDTRKDKDKQALAAVSAFWNACLGLSMPRGSDRKTKPPSQRRPGVFGRPPSKPPEFIAAIVRRLEAGESPAKIHEETKIPTGTMHGWRKQAAAKALAASQPKVASGVTET